METYECSVELFFFYYFIAESILDSERRGNVSLTVVRFVIRLFNRNSIFDKKFPKRSFHVLATVVTFLECSTVCMVGCCTHRHAKK